ncbi:MAG: T9SS type A sorting domain-containing protein [Candidatus Marinimicrobia bacterium]|nr:T9SS type A sorting domain-containing protein [Candidatus Neomarinimicrobiota bacterium]
MKKIIYICAILILTLTAGRAQLMTVHLQDGCTDTLQLDSIRSFYVVDSSANIVRLQSPRNGERDVPVHPLLQWQHVPGKNYEVLLCGDAGFTDTLVHAADIDTNTFRVSRELEIATRYYWKVRIADTGIWTAPWYFTTYRPSLPEKPVSLALFSGEDGQGFRLNVRHTAQIDSFCVVLSPDGRVFSDTAYADTMDMSVGGLQADSTYYVKVAGMNAAGKGPFSEVLAVTATADAASVMLINAFDRPTAGNSYDFIRQHAEALKALDRPLISASNEAVTDGIVSLCDHENVIYILGEESTADETFSDAEQDSVKTYLRQGGRMFVSGAEIAWDLDHRGSTSDKAFCHDFLRMRYLQDAPNNSSGTYYNVETIGDTIFSGLGSFSFDNGSHGTYNVRYPDVFGISGDSRGFLRYRGCSTGFAGVVYEGMFPGGSESGKIMITGFPLETVYPAEKRQALMEKFLQFAEQGLDVYDEAHIPAIYRLEQNYPNPFNADTRIRYTLGDAAMTEISIINVNGRTVQELLRERQTAGSHEIRWKAQNRPAGIYFCILKIDGKVTGVRKLILLK